MFACTLHPGWASSATNVVALPPKQICVCKEVFTEPALEPKRGTACGRPYSGKSIFLRGQLHWAVHRRAARQKSSALELLPCTCPSAMAQAAVECAEALLQLCQTPLCHDDDLSACDTSSDSFGAASRDESPRRLQGAMSCST